MTLNICWLYPEYMSTYGDRGNVICLQKRCLWRNIECKVKTEIKNSDLIFGGGAQDRQQSLILPELVKNQKVLEDLLNKNIPGLFVCGAPQLLGRPYLGLFDMETVFPKDKPRLIGNLITDKFVGFENHGGRTYLNSVKPFARVISGFGNNGEDGTEGAFYKNWIATYSHGPLLPKNPQIADWLIKTALEVKYKKEIQLEPLDDSLENKAHEFIKARYTR